MMRICALNDDEDSEDEIETDEIQVTKEAEETIAVSEYMRALKLKQNNNIEDALSLFSELLETQVIDDINLSNKDNKLFSVKYNCYRNIGLIYEEKNDKAMALKFLLNASELDDTDVYTMQKLGKLALSMEKLELAGFAFNKCLQKNPNHWPSADGILQLMCLSDNVFGAYGWALKLYNKDNTYERALHVLTEISEKFSSIIPFLEKSWNSSFHPSEKYKYTKSCFPVSTVPNELFLDKYDINFENFLIKKLTISSIGKFIIDFYHYLIENNYDLGVAFKLVDFIDTNELLKDNFDDCDNQLNETKNNDSGVNKDLQLPSSNDDNAEFAVPNNVDQGSLNNGNKDQSGSDNIDDAEQQKPKKRRGSDLSFLEQWGWHKNRRSTRKKSIQQDNNEPIDTTINSFLRRIFTKYYSDNYENNYEILIDDKIVIGKIDDNSNVNTNNENSNEKTNEFFNQETFHKNLSKTFQQFFNELKMNFDNEGKKDKMDIFLLMKKWLECVTVLWDKKLLNNLCENYIEIYEFFLNHNDLNNWNQLEYDEFLLNYLMELLYLELSFDKLNKKDSIMDNFEKSNLVNEIRTKLLHLIFYSGHIQNNDENNDYKNIRIRLLWMHYCIGVYDNDLNASLDFLYKLKELIGDNEDFLLYLPNQKTNNFISMEIINNMIVLLNRKINLKNIKIFYKENNFTELEVILKENLLNINNIDNNIINVMTLIEILLEILYTENKLSECIIWCEYLLNYTVNKFISKQNNITTMKWLNVINYILIYIESLLLKENYDIIKLLKNYQSRLIQNLIRIITLQLDNSLYNQQIIINVKIPVYILHIIIQYDEDNCKDIVNFNQQVTNNNNTNDTSSDIKIPNSIMLLFQIHDYLGINKLCNKDNGGFLLYILNTIVPILKTPLLINYNDILYEYIEQITYCLYNYPIRKGNKIKYIDEHDSINITLTWDRALQLFDIYRPDNLPEFNSYKLESITAEMEQLLQRTLNLIPTNLDPTQYTINIKNYISGNTNELPQTLFILPTHISCIYYLLADYYFKNHDFHKTIRFYVMDLTLNPERFDSWAGLALSKASKLETKLNSCDPFNTKEFLSQSEDALRCFKQCVKLDNKHSLLWIEYGSFAYTLHSFCSRNLKSSSDMLSIEQFTFVETRKELCLNIANECFTTINNMLNDLNVYTKIDNDVQDEKWLYYYMLGKIAEKRKDKPEIYLKYYIEASKLLYESNATYPIKINHTNPQNLSIESLEMYYRITSSIIKYIEQHKIITSYYGKIFNKMLKDLASSPFSFNQAKIDDNGINALKRKLAEKCSDTNLTISLSKHVKVSETTAGVLTTTTVIIAPTPTVVVTTAASVVPPVVTTVNSTVVTATAGTASSQPTSPLRRVSHESTATTGTTTTGTTGTGTYSSTSSSSNSSSSNSSSNSSSSSSDSDSDSSSLNDEADEKVDREKLLSSNDLNLLYKNCIKNFEECLSRFPEHYKSIYRLVNFYINGPDSMKNLDKARHLLLGSYKTAVGNQIQGLFAERKINNFFNGIWRIQSSEIDRPGSFSSHLSKCVIILMEVLKLSLDHKILLELALHLQRTPDSDKKYLKDTERKELYQQAMSFCVQTFRELLKKTSAIENNDDNLITIILDIYKAHKKCTKHMVSKDIIFNQLLVDSYRIYVQYKLIKVNEFSTINFYDVAMKFCQNQLNFRKNQEKYGVNSINTDINILYNQQLLNSIVASGATVQQQQQQQQQQVNLNNSGTTITKLPTTTIISSTNSTANTTISTVFSAPVATTNTSSISSAVVSTSSTTTATSNSSKLLQQLPGMARPRGRPVGSKNTQGQQGTSSTTSSAAAAAAANSYLMEQASMQQMLSMYNSSTMGANFLQAFQHQYQDQATMQALLAEYYKMANYSHPSMTNLACFYPGQQQQLQQQLLSGMSSNKESLTTAAGVSTTTPQAVGSPKLPQYDIKNLIASTASMTGKASSTINIGNNQLTITPTGQTGDKEQPTKLAQNTTKILQQHQQHSKQSTKLLQQQQAKLTTGLSKASPKMSIPDLPKSLTITPSPKVATNYEISKKTVNETTGKIKTSKKAAQLPYNRATASTSNTASANAAAMAAAAAANQQYASGLQASLSMQEYNRLYAEVMKNINLSNPMITSHLASMGLAGMTAPQQQQAHPSTAATTKKPYTKKQHHTGKHQSNVSSAAVAATAAIAALSPGTLSQLQIIPDSMKNKFNIPTASQQKKSTGQAVNRTSGGGAGDYKMKQKLMKQSPNTIPSGPSSSGSNKSVGSGSYNIPISTPSPKQQPLQSPTKSPVLNTVLRTAANTPPIMNPLQANSANKTLQQKLAERQKANASMNEHMINVPKPQLTPTKQPTIYRKEATSKATVTSRKNNDDDVIILE